MSTKAIGRLVDEDGAPWGQPRFTVVASDESGLFDRTLHTVTTDADGRFSLSYEADEDDLSDSIGRRRLTIRVRDRVGRVLLTREPLDPDDETLDLGTLTLTRAEATGFLVTLGTGTPQFVTAGNEVQLLVDNVDAWGHISATWRRATSSIDFTQLRFFTPTATPNSQNENPVLVFGFASPVPTAAQPRKVSAADERPEVVLREKARQADMSIRILLDHLDAGVFEMGDAEKVEEYFLGAEADRVHVYPFLPAIFRRMHMKLTVVDRAVGTQAEAISMASPFRPGYLDDAGHAIDDPRRGGAADTAFPLHDVSLSVKGPAVADAYDAFRLHWNAALPAADAQLRVEPMARPDSRPGTPDTLAALQVVRTLDDDLFADRPGGELGILEGYLRAFAQARQFIYCETQYLTNPTIAEALVKAVSDRPALRVIIALNIKPDIFTYPRMQQKLINNLFARIGKTRLGVFTRWTFQPANPPTRPRPRIVPVWLHSKVAIVDDVWATVGSANLDGASLDRTELWAIPEMVDRRHSELNFNLLNGVDGQPATNLVARLRRRLWSEHLGLAAEDPVLNAPSGAQALDLWTVQAQAALQALQDPLTAPAGSYLLPYPAGHPLTCHCCASHEKPRKHLDVVNVPRTIDAVKSLRGFDYKTGEWDPKTPIEIDS